MQIADLKIPQLTSLTHEEQLALVLAIRERRRFVEKPVRVPSAATRRTKRSALDTMTKEQLEQLLEALTK